MALNLIVNEESAELKPRITVFGVGGAGGNAVNNMIDQQLEGVEFVVANTDAQALQQSRAPLRIQMGLRVTEGLGAGAKPQIGAAAAEESIEQIVDHLAGAHMCFITAGMGGGTGTGAAPIIAQAARELGVLTVGVVTKPFAFEGQKRMRQAEEGIESLQKVVDTLIIIPNQNLFRLANEKTTFTEAFAMADDVLYQGVKGVTDLMVKPGLINLDFADVRSVMDEMGKAMMGTGEASGQNRSVEAAEKAIANPLLDEISLNGAKGVLINITGGYDMTLFELDEAANIIRDKVDEGANIIVGSTLDPSMEGILRVSVVATGIDASAAQQAQHVTNRPAASTASAPRQEAAAPVAPQPQQAVAAAQPQYRAEPIQHAAAEAPPSRDLFDAQSARAQAMQQQPVTDELPPPAYSHEVARAEPQAQQPAHGSMAAFDNDASSFVAPTRRPAGQPSNEAMERLRAAVSKAPTGNAPQRAAAQKPAEEAPRPRFGLGSLIGRMAGGQAEQPAIPTQARVQPRPAQPTAYDDEQDHEQDRIEIPAFLRRQAN